MCGIFGYSGQRSASKTIVDGLKRLEYRGYDSWGVAVKIKNEIKIVKKIGKIGDVKKNLEMGISSLGIGHTRWATHGGVTQNNAHPHYSTDKSFVVAQNGIVENFQDLKISLSQKGYEFNTQTDTEVIVRLIEEKLKRSSDFPEAIRLAFLDLKGRNTIIVLDAKNNQVIAIRNGSPLVVGLGENEIFISSDTMSFSERTNKVIFIDNFQMVKIRGNEVEIYDINLNKKLDVESQKLDNTQVKFDKGEYKYFTLKEIVEQQHTIREAVSYSDEELEPLAKAIKKARGVYTVGAGTAFFAAGQIAYFLRKYSQIQAIELKAYEVDSYVNNFTKDDVLIVVSQSGETADTIEVIRFAKEKGVKIACIVNMVGSTIPRMSDFVYLSRSGPEIAVASTKAFTAQVSWGLLLAMNLVGKHHQAQEDVLNLSKSLQDGFFSDRNFVKYKKLAKKLAKHEHFFVLGKGQNYYAALEGALKVKEITYKHFEGFAAGELKHGVIALIEKGTPVFLLVSKDENEADMVSAVAEVKARGAWVIGVGSENNDLFDDFLKIPESKYLDIITHVISFQILAYYLGVELGFDPDKPRNLAKSVTVL